MRCRSCPSEPVSLGLGFDPELPEQRLEPRIRPQRIENGIGLQEYQSREALSCRPAQPLALEEGVTAWPLMLA
jgi:hypothetical protein